MACWSIDGDDSSSHVFGKLKLVKNLSDGVDPVA
jgi:hypothetical protein